MSFDVAIIGGGISGLATAQSLREKGLRVAVLERQVRAGGNAVSERIGGFLMEHGPSSLNAGSPVALQASHKLGLDAKRCDLGAGVRQRYLVRDGRLHGISVRPLGLFASNYLSLAGRTRLLIEPLVPARRGGADESVAAFFTRRFGREFAERLVDPLVGGLFAGDAGSLSLKAAFPRMAKMEASHGSILVAAAKARMAARSMPGRRLFSWRDGVGSLPKTLAAGLGSALHTGVAVRRLRQAGRRWRVETARQGTIDAGAVVIATQPHVAAGLVESLQPVSCEALAAIAAPPLAVVFLGYTRRHISHPLDGLGYLTPSSEQRLVSGVLFCSTMFAGRAPEGQVALAAYVGGRRAPQAAALPERDLIDLVEGELHDLVGAVGPPTVARVRHWSRGIPQLDLGHGARMADIHMALTEHPGLFLSGNYFDGVSVTACLERAGETAEQVAGYLMEAGRDEVWMQESFADMAKI